MRMCKGEVKCHSIASYPLINRAMVTENKEPLTDMNQPVIMELTSALSYREFRPKNKIKNLLDYPYLM